MGACCSSSCPRRMYKTLVRALSGAGELERLLSEGGAGGRSGGRI